MISIVASGWNQSFTPITSDIILLKEKVRNVRNLMNGCFFYQWKLKYFADELDLSKLRTNWHVRDSSIKVLPDEDDRKLAFPYFSIFPIFFFSHKCFKSFLLFVWNLKDKLNENVLEHKCFKFVCKFDVDLQRFGSNLLFRWWFPRYLSSLHRFLVLSETRYAIPQLEHSPPFQIFLGYF